MFDDCFTCLRNWPKAVLADQPILVSLYELVSENALLARKLVGFVSWVIKLPRFLQQHFDKIFTSVR